MSKNLTALMSFLTAVMLPAAAAAQNASVNDFITLSKQLRRVIDEAAPRKVPDHKLELVATEISAKLDARRDNITKSKAWTNVHNNYLQSLKLLLFETYGHLREQGKILYLNEQLYEKFNIKKYLCEPKYQCARTPGCKKLKGFYVHLLDTVFVDPSVPDSELSDVLLHEIVHSMQDSYRLPLDVALLAEYRKNNKVPEDQALLYLSFMYELQANWYEMTAAQKEIWLNETVKIGRAADTGQRLGMLLTQLPVIAQLTARNRTYRAWGETSLIKKLPDIDHPRRGADYGFLYERNSESAFYFNEPVIFARTNFVQIGNADFGLHKKFVESLECGYFGDLPFLFQRRANDQVLIKEFVNQFYSKILTDQSSPFLNSFTSDLECAALGRKLQASGTSPFLAWLNLDIQEIRQCSVYKDFDEDQRNEIVKLFSSSGDTPFNMLNFGTEGGGSSLDLLPSIHFLPQIDINPLPDDKGETHGH